MISNDPHPDPAAAADMIGPDASAPRSPELTIPIRPATRRPTHCPWGHDLTVGGVRHGWCQDYATPEYLCEACHALPDRAGRWATIDPSITHHHNAHTDETQLTLIITPPKKPAGIGTIALRRGPVIFGHIQLSLCALDRSAVLLDLIVAPRHRRRGVGSVLAAAATLRARNYRWSTNPIGADPITIAFWARLGLPGPPPPRGCTHQITLGAVPWLPHS